MSLAFRPVFAVLFMTLASGSLAAPKKKAPAAPPVPTACSDFYAHVNNPWLLSHPLPVGVQSFSRWDELNDTAAKQTVALISSTSRSRRLRNEISRLIAEAPVTLPARSRVGEIVNATSINEPSFRWRRVSKVPTLSP